MSLWVCPQCDREGQSHVSVPGQSVDQVFEPWPPVYREIYDRLVAHLGPLHEDAVGVGVFLKTSRKFAEIRPKARSLSLALVLTRPIAHPLLARSLPFSGGRYVHFFKLTRLEDVDERIVDWMAEAYDA